MTLSEVKDYNYDIKSTYVEVAATAYEYYNIKSK